jgi:16S rRNA (cytidine1402-2'-O)-methyltransferase
LAESSGRLFVVAVPIGNLEDITLRALRVLREADVIACEDTRRTGQLLELLGLPRRPMFALHDHNEDRQSERLIARLEAGEKVALVSDAGTPTISDPGFPLIRAVAEAGLTVVPVPGPCAAIAALCASGLPTDRFRFVGFPPGKREAQRGMLEALQGAPETVVFYVGPHDLAEFLVLAAEVLGGARPAVIARELTKMYEELRRGTLAELAETPGVIRGEVVLLVGGAVVRDEAPTADDIASAARAVLAEGFTGARAAKELARRTGLGRDEAYRAVLSAREAE